MNFAREVDAYVSQQGTSQAGGAAGSEMGDVLSMF